jgi:hypothetical protein
MITWMRSAVINHGKRAGGIEWALKISDYVNDTFGTNISVHGNVAGPINQIHWVATYESLAAFEKVAGRIIQDEGYNQLLAESSEANFYDTHSFKDALFQSLG